MRVKARLDLFIQSVTRLGSGVWLKTRIADFEFVDLLYWFTGSMLFREWNFIKEQLPIWLYTTQNPNTTNEDQYKGTRGFLD